MVEQPRVQRRSTVAGRIASATKRRRSVDLPQRRRSMEHQKRPMRSQALLRRGGKSNSATRRPQALKAVEERRREVEEQQEELSISSDIANVELSAHSVECCEDNDSALGSNSNSNSNSSSSRSGSSSAIDFAQVFAQGEEVCLNLLPV